MAAEDDARRAPAARRRGIAAIADQGWLLMAAPPLFWAGNIILGRAVHDLLPPVGLAFWRWVFASLLALPLAWPHLRVDSIIMLRATPMMFLLSLLGVAMFNTLVYIAADTTTAVNMVTLQTTSPVIIVAAGFFLFGLKVTPRQGLGILVSLAGAMILISHGDLRALVHLELNRGDLLIGTAVAGYAVYTALLRLAPPVHPFSFLFGTFLLAALMLAPLYLYETLFIETMPLNLTAIGAVAYATIFPSILAYLGFNRAVALLGPNVTGLSLHLVPVFGTILSVVLLGELPQLYHLVGIPLIFAGIFLATRKPAAAKARA